MTILRPVMTERSILAAGVGRANWFGEVPKLGWQDVMGSPTAMTVAMRYVPDEGAGELVLHDTSNGAYRTFLGYRATDGVWRVFTPDGAPSRAIWVPPGKPCSAVLTVDTEGFQLYVNGEAIFTGTTAVMLKGTAPRQVRLGADLSQGRQTWLPFASVFDRRVNDAEALRLHRWMQQRVPR